MQLQSFNTASSLGNTPKLISIAPTDGMCVVCGDSVCYDCCIVDLATPERMKELDRSVRRHAATKQSRMDTSLLTTTSHAVPSMLAAVPKRPMIGDIVKRKIEYDDDGLDDDLDQDHNDDDVNLSLRTPEFQLPSSSVTTPSNSCDTARLNDGINLNTIDSPSPEDPHDILADNIASYVAAASSGDSSPDSKVI